ncbi:AI-2E family transporter [soil metagenome]|nr:AI-2E family transporter [Acidobacteriota bacterium]
MAGHITLAVVLIFALYICWLIVQPFVNVLLWASVLTMVFYPLHRRIRLGVRQPEAAAALSTLLVIVLILIPITFVTVAIVRELRDVAEALQTNVQQVGGPTIPGLGLILGRLDGYVDIDPVAAQKFLAERMQIWGAALAGSTLVVVGGALGAVVQTGLVVFTMFYMFRDGDRIRTAVYDILPIERVQVHDIIARMKEVIAATIYGVLLIAAIQGTLGTFIFWVLGLPSPLLWGVVMFVFCMIPMAGAFLVWVPAAIYLGFTGAYFMAGILVVWGVVVIGGIDNLLSPRLVGQRARLHELLIFFGVLGGLQVFGILGVVLGPVVVAVTLAMVEMVRQVFSPPAELLREPTIIERQAAVRDVSP